MSWLSERSSGLGGSLLGFGAGPLEAALGYKLGEENFGPGVTGKPSDNPGLSFSPAAQERANKIIQDIQAHNAGTYGEGQIGEAVRAFDGLEKEVKAGKISQADYVGISGSILPQVWDFAHRLASGGSSAAKAAEYAGMSKIDTHLGNYNIYKSGQELLGRDLTPEEFAKAAPIFQQPNGETLGNAWMANLKQIDDQNPLSSSNKKKAAGFGSDVNNYFKTALGRDATNEEKAHFGGLLATGNLDAYGLNQFLQGTPEYQTQQDTKFRSGVSSELEKTDLSFFNKAKQNVMSQFMQNGTGGSSALDSALTDLMGQIADKRSAYMANLSSTQYGGNKDLALGNYQNAMNQYLGEQNYNRGTGASNQNYLQGRSDSISDYERQMNDYMSYGNMGQTKPNKGANAMNGAMQGAAAGSAAGPWGALIGAGAGGAFGYLNS